MAESKSESKEHNFIKVEQIRPWTSGFDLKVKVVSVKMMQKGNQVRQNAECLVGDETGMIIFNARNDQVKVVKEGCEVTIVNAKLDMHRGSMRLSVDRWGSVSAADKAADITVNEDNNLSLIEYEMVNVVAA